MKTSSKRASNLIEGITQWDRDKIQCAEYQLEFYRKMLAAQGINARRIHLKILPIYLRNVKYNKTGESTISGVEIDEPIDVSPRDEIVQEVSNHIFQRDELSIDAKNLKLTALEDIEKIYNKTALSSASVSYDEDFLFRKRIIKDLGGGKYEFKSVAQKNNVVIKANSKAEIIEKYKKDQEESAATSGNKFDKIKEQLEEALNRFNSPNENKTFDFERDDKFLVKYPSRVKANFRKYFSEPGWKILTDDESNTLSDALLELGVIVLKNDALDPKHPVIDIVHLSKFSVDSNYILPFSKTIFGQFNLPVVPQNAEKSTIGNVLLYRGMAIANILAESMPEVRFDEIKAIQVTDNPNNEISVSKQATKLQSNFEKLCNLGGIDNHFNNKQFLSIEEQFFNLFKATLQEG